VSLTNPHYLNLLHHATGVHIAGSNFFTGDIQNMERRQPSNNLSPRAFPVKSIHEYLKDELCFDEFCEQSQAEIRAQFDNLAGDADEAKYLYDREMKVLASSYSAPSVSRSRIVNGFRSGAIDFIAGALIKTPQGWVDENNDVKFGVHAGLMEVAKTLKSRVKVVRDFTTEQLELAEKSGVLRSGFEVIAELIENDGQKQWKDVGNKTMFDHGDLIRLLHHRDEPCIIYTSKLNHSYYHGSLSTSETPLDNLPVRTGMSKQGDGVYATASLDEAIKIYANPYSFESRGKLISLKENEGIDDNAYDKSHIYSMTTTANIYNADSKSRSISFDDIPSLPMVLALANENSINKTFATNKWIDMKNSSSTFEVYQHITELSEAYGDNNLNVLKTLIRSMGFEGIEIEVPKSEIEDYKSKLESLQNISEIRFEEYGAKKEEVLKQVNKYIRDMVDAIPAKADISHLIVFDESKVTRQHVAMLPKAVKVEYGEEKPNDIYHSQEPVTLSMITKPSVQRESNLDTELSY
jgi:hypothetical protein